MSVYEGCTEYFIQRPRYDRDDAHSEHMDDRRASTRAETPEEGEI